MPGPLDRVRLLRSDRVRCEVVRQELQKGSAADCFGELLIAGSAKIISSRDGHAMGLVIESSLLVTLLASKFRRTGAHIQ